MAYDSWFNDLIFLNNKKHPMNEKKKKIKNVSWSGYPLTKHLLFELWYYLPFSSLPNTICFSTDIIEKFPSQFQIEYDSDTPTKNGWYKVVNNIDKIMSYKYWHDGKWYFDYDMRKSTPLYSASPLVYHEWFPMKEDSDG